MDAEGSNIRRITTEGSYHDSPAWSPDGMRMAYVSRIEDRFDIYVFNLKSNDIIKLTENCRAQRKPLLVARRPAPGFFLQPQRQIPIVSGRLRRPQCPADHFQRRKQNAQMAEIAQITRQKNYLTKYY